MNNWYLLLSLAHPDVGHPGRSPLLIDPPLLRGSAAPEDGEGAPEAAGLAPRECALQLGQDGLVAWYGRSMVDGRSAMKDVFI